MEKHCLYRTPLPLYKITLHSVMSQKNLDICSLKTLPGYIKEDMLQFGLLQRIGNNNLGEFLHPNITKLDTFPCQIANEDLLQISLCKQLRMLVIQPPKFYRFTHSPSILTKLFSSLPRLVQLQITNNDGVTDDVIATIKESCYFIQKLDISGSLNLTDTAANHLSQMCHLRVMDLSHTAIGDCGLKALSQGPNSKAITHLCLNNCKIISDIGIDALIRGCEHLNKLKVCGWPRVSIECQLALSSFLNRQQLKTCTWMELF